jgi:hypothetical protein
MGNWMQNPINTNTNANVIFLTFKMDIGPLQLIGLFHEIRKNVIS